MRKTQFDIFDSADDNALEIIEKNTKLSGSAKDRMFNASMEKLGKMKAQGSCDVVTAPSEKTYSDSKQDIKLRRYAPIISAAACLIAVIGISGALISLNSPDKKPRTDSYTSSAVTSEPMADNSSDTSARSEKPSALLSEAEAESSSPETDSSTSQLDEPIQIHLPDSQAEITDNRNNNNSTDNDDQPQPSEDKTVPSQDDQHTDEHRADGDNTDYDMLTKYHAVTKILEFYIDELSYVENGSISHDDTRMWFDANEALVESDIPENSGDFEFGYFLVTDPSYSGVNDIKQVISKRTTGSCREEWIKNILGAGGASNNGKPMYAEFDGKLYVGIHAPTGTSHYWTDDIPLITDMTDTSFTAKVFYQAYPGSGVYSMKIYAVSEDGTWKISKTE